MKKQLFAMLFIISFSLGAMAEKEIKVLRSSCIKAPEITSFEKAINGVHYNFKTVTLEEYTDYLRHYGYLILNYQYSYRETYDYYNASGQLITTSVEQYKVGIKTESIWVDRDHGYKDFPNNVIAGDHYLATENGKKVTEELYKSASQIELKRQIQTAIYEFSGDVCSDSFYKR